MAKFRQATKEESEKMFNRAFFLKKVPEGWKKQPKRLGKEEDSSETEKKQK